jgi:formylglycine-generating enzyme required for sulfatase activity
MLSFSQKVKPFFILTCMLLALSCGQAEVPSPDNVDLDEMVFVPSGEFIMGSDLNWKEEPQHIAYTDAFWIDKYEVTLSEYAKFINATGHRPPKSIYWLRTGTHAPGSELLPVVYVDYYDACAFCEWEGKRLPTEAEWEKAARGTDGRTYPWGNDWNPDYANTWEKGPHKRSPVNAYPQGASPYGALNMGGNVWEWTSSWFVNHPGAEFEFDFTGTDMVLKGGSWLDFADSTRPARRNEFTPFIRFNTLGFRCVKEEGKEKGIKGDIE